MKNWLITQLGGFPDLDAAIEHIRKTDDPRKEEILSEAVKYLYNTISADEILQYRDGGYRFKDRVLQKIEVDQLKSEAIILSDMKLWKVLMIDIQYQLGKKVWQEARVKDDIVWGQLLTYLNDIIRARVKQLRTG